eukprot:784379_1
MNPCRLLSMLGLVLLLSGSVFGAEQNPEGESQTGLEKFINHFLTIAVFVVIFCVVKLFAKGAIKLALIILVVVVFLLIFASNLGWLTWEQKQVAELVKKAGTDKFEEIRNTNPDEFKNYAHKFKTLVNGTYNQGYNAMGSTSKKMADVATEAYDRFNDGFNDE